MIRCYAYTRVSTVKQGEKGVSLQEQRAAIERYAAKQNIDIAEWFEERVTAAKKGRPLFTKMLKGLAKGEAAGVVIHKIDRSARNLRDWSDLGDLIDAGVDVHFANESIDLRSRGGRLSADIQAVVAADYIRNLREEIIKGIRGRLTQGLFPFGAPLGYRDTGKGRPKEIDPSSGLLIRQAFELYASGRHTLATLASELHSRGLRNKNGRRLCLNSLSLVLNNPFYAGLIRIKATGETYEGLHTPLISMNLFKQVQTRLARKLRSQGWRHDFLFRGLFTCARCGRLLLGEIQKGHRYYRCHTRGCPTRCFREEVLEQAILDACPPIAATDAERQLLLEKLEGVVHQDRQDAEFTRAQMRAQLGALKERHTKLVDALLDGAIDKTSFDERKRALLEEERMLRDSLEGQDDPATAARRFLMDTLELASTAQQGYKLANTAFRRELAIKLCSNRTVAGNEVVVEPHFALSILRNRRPFLRGAPHQDTTRTIRTKDLWRMWSWAKRWVRREAECARATDQRFVC